jgi:hypothetical protein
MKRYEGTEGSKKKIQRPAAEECLPCCWHFKSNERNEKQMEIICDQNARGRRKKPSYLWASGIVDEELLVRMDPCGSLATVIERGRYELGPRSKLASIW